MSQGVARVVAGRYRLVRLLGRGGMGVVWHAHDELLGRDVAVKEVRVAGVGPAEPADPVAARALREARAAAQLRHPGIVTVHDVVVDDGRPWIVMELVGGRALGQVVADGGVLGERRAAVVGLRVLDALGAAHRRGVLHRDVKPANILVDGDRVVLTDFGIAAIDGATALTATGQMVGSPAYLAPERVNGRPATAAGDLWALGVTLYAVVAGRSPFAREDTLSTFAAVLTSDPVAPVGVGRLWPVVQGLLVKDPARRLTADRAAELLAAVAHPQTAPDPRTAPRWHPWRRARPAGGPRPVEQPTTPAGPVIDPPARPSRHGPAGEPATPRTVPDETAAALPATARIRPEADRPPVGGTAAQPPGTRPIRWISALLLAVVTVAAAAIWVLPAWRHRGPDEAPPAGSSAGLVAAPPSATSAASSPPASRPRTPPAPPPGFRTVTYHDTFVFAVPRTWVDRKVPGGGWVSEDDIPVGSNLHTSAWREATRATRQGEAKSAAAYLTRKQGEIQNFLDYRPVRLTSVAAPSGASSAAEWEYTTVHPPHFSSRYGRAMAKAIALPRGVVIVVAVYMSAATPWALIREWQKARSTVIRILNSVRDFS